jgi:hypothetical protein
LFLREGANWLEVSAIDRVPAHLPTPGDMKFVVTVEAEGFRGRGSTWVVAECLTTFVQQLRKLEQVRRGEAELVSMSPDEFRLRVCFYDGAGHTMVEGRIGSLRQALEFRFSFCPSQLSAMVSEFAALTSP